MARPTKLTPEIQDEICQAVEVGLRADEAGPLVGVGAATVREWLARGRGTDPARPATPLYAAFAAAVEVSEAKLKQAVTAHWRRQMPESWQACRDFMARRFPDEWGESTKVKAEMSGKLTVEVVYADEAGDRAGD
jgi:hypothetical protein